ncbi:MAG TPA: hypothetical protein VEG60_30420 [Candidatus Binatia bacterium]|nr:hypothetical protein [Candidatus Binatia bacterium]
MKIGQANASIISELRKKVETRAQQAKNLSEAAEALTSEIYNQFSDSVVLARLFVTVPFGDLPTTIKQFVQNLAKSAGADKALKNTTPVLSLLGTTGQETDWNSPSNSKGHRGIPLISSAFVNAIPMISRLLRELGIPIDWIDSHDSEIIKKSVGTSAGFFFVDDAAQATDHEGRKIIAAQDFVSKYNVKSVFGIGEAYANGQMAVNIVFCKDSFARSSAEHFLNLINSFKNTSAPLVASSKLFA